MSTTIQQPSIYFGWVNQSPKSKIDNTIYEANDFNILGHRIGQTNYGEFDPGSE
jgi:hypothetical protein